ncbi:MAG: type II toxin-antitoxin system RelE/ParE family toxin [Kofleriaceae bacterium]
MTRLRAHPAADREAMAATTWYRERSEDAAIDFARAVREGLQSIRQRPAAWPHWERSEVRRKVLRRFPYSIFYLVEHDAVVIVAIAHHKRRPGYWKQRLRRSGA